MVRWGTHGAGEGAGGGVGEACASLPSSLTVDEGGEATYRVRLSSDPGQPVWVALWWEGDEDVGNPLSHQQFKWLLPSNYASANPNLYLDPEYTAAWNAGVTERDTY